MADPITIATITIPSTIQITIPVILQSVLNEMLQSYLYYGALTALAVVFFDYTVNGSEIGADIRFYILLLVTITFAWIPFLLLLLADSFDHGVLSESESEDGESEESDAGPSIKGNPSIRIVDGEAIIETGDDQ